MAEQSLFQSGEHCHALLAQGREIAADAAEGHRPSLRTETAGDLLLDLDHPNIALGQAICRWCIRGSLFCHDTQAIDQHLCRSFGGKDLAPIMKNDCWF